MNIDSLFHKTYNSESYNCAHFVCDVFESLGYVSSRNALEGMLTRRADRSIDTHRGKLLEPLEQPISPCMALFQGPGVSAHVGVFIDNMILHIESDGVKFSKLNIAMLGFRKVRFYGIK